MTKTTKNTKETVYMRNCKAQFHPTKANSKLGNKKIFGVSYAPAAGLLYLKSGVLVSDCLGTCGAVDCSGCVKACYGTRDYRQYPSATLNRVENTMQLREDPDGHFEAIKNYAIATGAEIIRYTESGELESTDQLRRVVKLARDLPNVFIYLYTKNYKALREFFAADELPQNMVILVSVWEDLGKEEYKEFSKHAGVKCFAVNSDIKVNAMCPAYKEVNGKVVRNAAMTCEKCGLCTSRKAAKIIGCLEH